MDYGDDEVKGNYAITIANVKEEDENFIKVKIIIKVTVVIRAGRASAT